MAHWRILIAILCLLAPSQALLVGAQDLRPQVSVADTGVQFDLAAMSLRPSDLDTIGLEGFGLAAQSSLRDPIADAQIEAVGGSEEVELRLAAYRDSGMQYRYFGSMLRPRVPIETLPTGLIAADMRISTAVAEYGTVAGAQKGFAYLIGSFDEIGGRNVPRERTFGDESVMFRSAAKETLTRERFQRMELAFRYGRLICQVIVTDYDNERPDPAFVEQIGELFLARIEHELSEPGAGLSPHVLRIVPLARWAGRGRLRDFYTRIERHNDVMFAQVVAAIRDGADIPEADAIISPQGVLLPRDTYMFWTPVGEGDPLELPLFVNWLDSYDSPEQAAAALNAVTTNLGPGYFNVRELHVIAERIGEESRTFAYHYEDTVGTVRGYVVMARVGSTIMRIQVDGPGGILRTGVEELGKRQAICLRVSEPCVPVTVLWASVNLLPVSANLQDSRSGVPGSGPTLVTP